MNFMDLPSNDIQSFLKNLFFTISRGYILNTISIMIISAKEFRLYQTTYKEKLQNSNKKHFTILSLASHNKHNRFYRWNLKNKLSIKISQE